MALYLGLSAATLTCPKDAAERAAGKGLADFKRRQIKITSYIWPQSPNPEGPNDAWFSPEARNGAW